VIHLVADMDVCGQAGELTRRVRELLAGGLPSLQLRGRGRSTAELVALGRPLRKLAGEAGALFIVNGSIEAARRLGADGVHLPAVCGRPDAARRALLGTAGVGVSCHDRCELKRAAGADWVFLSPVFATASKPSARPLGTEGLADLVPFAPAPLYALGGVKTGSVAACLEAGAAGVAAIRGLLGPQGERLLAEALAWDG
jgi:thiamine-phosphate pyrophosphorylase